jgi:hypothetical protein
MEVSEWRVDGPWTPSHSTLTVVGAAPSAGGLDHNRNPLSLIASMGRMVVIAVTATCIRFNILPLVILNTPVLDPFVKRNT